MALLLTAPNNLNRLRQSFVAFGPHGLKVIESSENVVMPARRKREQSKFRPNDVSCTVRAEQPVHEQKVLPALLRYSNVLAILPSVQSVET